MTDRLMRGDVYERLARWSVVIPCLPIVVMAVRKFASDWLPLGDAAYFAVRSSDVLTANHPLLGAWSSGSSGLEKSINNLGPLQLDLLAPFTHLFGPEGLAIGVALLNIAAVVGVWAVCRRMVGPAGVVAVMGVTALLEWTIGSRSLIEARQQWALILPFWCLLFVAWAVSAGRAWVMPWLVLVASLIVQTHLTFALPTGMIAIVALGGFAVTRWAAGDPDRDPEPLLRPLAVTTAVGVVCWSQPLWDQFWGKGNLGRALGAPGQTAGIGGSGGARVLTDILGQPPFWLGDSILEVLPQRAAHGGVVSVVAVGHPRCGHHRSCGAGRAPAFHSRPTHTGHVGAGVARHRMVVGVDDPAHVLRCGATELPLDLADRRARHAVGGVITRRGGGDAGGCPPPRDCERRDRRRGAGRRAEPANGGPRTRNERRGGRTGWRGR
ncbi:MAG: hypothetical protein WKF58_18240 [Ilumatobacteraceae bacterium]